MEEKINRLKRWERNKLGPFLVEIWPTNRCNLRCVMCGTWANRRRLEEKGIIYNPSEEVKDEISEKILFDLVDDSKEFEVKEFLITGGGEPFIRKNTTLELMKKIKMGNMFGNLNTNGTLIKKEDIKKIIEIDWDMIMFSIDASDAETHDYIRGVKGCFQKSKENLLIFKNLKKKSRSDKPKIVFNSVLSSKIYNKTQKLIKFACEVGCEDITFIPIIPYDESVRKIKLDEHQKLKLEENIKKLIEISKKLGVNTNLNELNLSTSGTEMNEEIINEIKDSPKDLIHAPCFEPFLHFLIKANGEATFCCMIENSPENIKEKSLKEIWFGNYFSQMRKDFMNKKIKDECKHCVFSQFIRNKKISYNLQNEKFLNI